MVGLEQYEDAKQAVIDGLQYEPNDKVRLFFFKFFTLLFFSLTRKSKELNNFLQEIEEKIKEADKAFPDTVQ